ncbi:Major facilitator superfamily domain, general substrate transporter [Fusarium austroafricanum]|uniref:Major facilitator superfamily domain, general substrate transporter n=1 Tax=Fusarium austroafricanum TaxID=2364996 RepID=A0A8H4JT90_9HYPO|nr:Major facilitator superfamily domain, general substrate transporter [Fusarium austroafricanum]
MGNTRESSPQRQVDDKVEAMGEHVESQHGPGQSENMKIYGESEVITYTEEENKKVKRKIDFILLPLMCGCYVFSFLDKTLLNYASIFGLKQALHLHGSNYSWLGSVFYIGYMIGSMCWAKLAQRFPQHIGKFIAFAVLFWAVMILLTPLCFNFSGIMAVRFFLGMFESIIGPIFVIVTSNWWTRPEQAFRSAFWLGGTPIGNFIGGLLTYALGSSAFSHPFVSASHPNVPLSVHSSVATWKIFFLFFGSFSFFFSLVLMYLMPDNQSNARWLNERQKHIAIERVRENRTVTSESRWKWPQFWEALRDPQTVFFFVTAMGNTMPSTFASQFSSQIVAGFGFTKLQTTLVSTCPAAVIQLTTFLTLSYLASRRKNIRLLLALLTSIPPLIGASLLHALPVSNRAGRLAGYYLTYTHSMSFTLCTGLMASNYAGSTKKATASGIIFAGWAAGLIAGPQFFLESEAPVYTLAFKMLMGCYALMIILPILQFAWYRYENNRRDKLARRNGSSANDSPDFTDKTDFEQWEEFRYTM